MAREEQFDYLFKIVIIGDSGVGKTNLLSRFIDDAFSMDSKPTIGVQFATKTSIIEDKVIKNQIWDTAGQQRFRAITNAYYRGAQGAIVVYDLTKQRSFQNIGKWLSQLRENAEQDISILLLANKSDLENRDVKQDAVEQCIASNKLLYIQTSALSGQNVNEAFQMLIKQIYERVKKNPDLEQTPSPQKTEQRTAQGNLKKQSTQNINKQQVPKNEKIKLDPKKQNEGKKKKDGCC